MTDKEYDEAVYLASLINANRVPDWSVSYDGIKSLAKALAIANGYKKCADLNAEIENADPGGLY